MRYKTRSSLKRYVYTPLVATMLLKTTLFLVNRYKVVKRG